MIGQVVRMNKFGLFIHFSSSDGSDSSVKIETGLLRWSKLPKRLPKVQIGDFIGVTVEKRDENNKIDLSYFEKNFKSTYGAFLEEIQEKLVVLQDKNREEIAKLAGK